MKVINRNIRWFSLKFVYVITAMQAIIYIAKRLLLNNSSIIVALTFMENFLRQIIAYENKKYKEMSFAGE